MTRETTATEMRMMDDMNRLRKEALIRRVCDALEGTIQLQGMTPDTRTRDVIAWLTTDSAAIVGVLVEAVDILEAIIFASDGCMGHRECVHSMEPWQRARALLAGKWDADSEPRMTWPAQLAKITSPEPPS